MWGAEGPVTTTGCSGGGGRAEGLAEKDLKCGGAEGPAKKDPKCEGSSGGGGGIWLKEY